MATLSEAESKRLVASYGVAVPPEEVVTTPAEAAAAAERIGFPVVAKLCGPAIAHKTERGLVRLGLRDGAAVEAAARSLLDLARPDDGPIGVLIGAMVAGSRELIAGLVRDPQFGPCVMLGMGGVLAEALGDVVFRLVPLSATDAREAVDSLPFAALLGPFRGEAAVDRDRLAGVLVALGEIATAEAFVRSVDLNPLIVVDGVPVAVDALVEVEG